MCTLTLIKEERINQTFLSFSAQKSSIGSLHFCVLKSFSNSLGLRTVYRSPHTASPKIQAAAVANSFINSDGSLVTSIFAMHPSLATQHGFFRTQLKCYNFQDNLPISFLGQSSHLSYNQHQASLNFSEPFQQYFASNNLQSLMQHYLF